MGMSFIEAFPVIGLCSGNCFFPYEGVGKLGQFSGVRARPRWNFRPPICLAAVGKAAAGNRLLSIPAGLALPSALLVREPTVQSPGTPPLGFPGTWTHCAPRSPPPLPSLASSGAPLQEVTWLCPVCQSQGPGLSARLPPSLWAGGQGPCAPEPSWWAGWAMVGLSFWLPVVPRHWAPSEVPEESCFFPRRALLRDDLGLGFFFFVWP